MMLSDHTTSITEVDFVSFGLLGRTAQPLRAFSMLRSSSIARDPPVLLCFGELPVHERRLAPQPSGCRDCVVHRQSE